MGHLTDPHASNTQSVLTLLFLPHRTLSRSFSPRGSSNGRQFSLLLPAPTPVPHSPAGPGDERSALRLQKAEYALEQEQQAVASLRRQLLQARQQQNLSSAEGEPSPVQYSSNGGSGGGEGPLTAPANADAQVTEQVCVWRMSLRGCWLMTSGQTLLNVECGARCNGDWDTFCVLELNRTAYCVL